MTADFIDSLREAEQLRSAARKIDTDVRGAMCAEMLNHAADVIVAMSLADKPKPPRRRRAVSLLAWRIAFAGLLAIAALVSWGSAQAWGSGSPVYAAGSYHACSGSSPVLCWGDNSAGELGTDPAVTKQSTTPLAVLGLPAPAVELAAGYNRTCALLTGSQVWCWGRQAKLDSNGKPVTSWQPVKLQGVPAGAHGLTVGNTHACVLDAAGIPWCWGENDRGQIGDGTTTPRAKATKTKAKAALQVQASDGYSCAQRTGGVQCWGKSHGTSGDPLNPEGLVVNSTTPKAISGLGLATQISATGDFVCARLSTGKVVCWGENDHGQLGDGTLAGRSTPAPVAALAPSVQVVATANHACSLAADGWAACWGRGDHGQIGDGTTADHLTPAAVLLPAPATRLYGASSGHWTVALTSVGWVGWGRNQYGQLGDGTLDDQPTPVAVTIP